MITYENISMLFKIEILGTENFSIEQKKELISICEKIDKVKTSTNAAKALRSIQEYKKLEKELIQKFGEYRGNMERLDQRIKGFEVAAIPFISDFQKGVKNIKASINRITRMMK